MTTTQAPPVRTHRRAAWLLVATLPAYVAYLAVAVTTVARRVHTSSDLTPADLDSLGIAWPAVHLLWVAPTVLAAAGLTLLARRLDTRATRWVPVLAAMACACVAGYLVINLLAFGSSAPTWGESPLYAPSVVASLAAGWLGVHPATLLVVVALVRGNVARRTAAVVGVVYALYVVMELLVYLPILLGPTELAGFVGGVPPFLLGLLWAALGGGLLRAGLGSRM